MAQPDLPVAGPDDLLAWVDRVADQFEEAWRSGTPPRVADFLAAESGRTSPIRIATIAITTSSSTKVKARRTNGDMTPPETESAWRAAHDCNWPLDGRVGAGRVKPPYARAGTRGWVARAVADR